MIPIEELPQFPLTEQSYSRWLQRAKEQHPGRIFGSFLSLLTKTLNYKQMFYDDLPYDLVQEIYQQETQIFKNVFKDQKIQILRIGSCSIKGMSGFLYPDLAVIVQSIPLSFQLVKQLQQFGYFCAFRFAKDNLDQQPFLKTGFLKGKQFAMTVHIGIKGMMKLKDALQHKQVLEKDPIKLKEYKEAKIKLFREKADMNMGSFYQYKVQKAMFIQDQMSSLKK